MNLDEYQQQACSTLAPKTTTLVDKATMTLLNAVLGLCGESGELADVVKKHVFHGHDFDEKAAKEELGDVLWYVAVCAEALDVDLSEIAAANVDKLKSRYGGKFSTERSIH